MTAGLFWMRPVYLQIFDLSVQHEVMEIRHMAVIHHRREVDLVADLGHHLMEEIISRVHIEHRVCTTEACRAGRAWRKNKAVTGHMRRGRRRRDDCPGQASAQTGTDPSEDRSQGCRHCRRWKG